METGKRKKFTRKSSAAMALALVAALLLTGTFAWVSINQLGLNQTSGSPLPPGGRLHDDFEDAEDWTKGGNKDVYIENYGERPIFVRIQLFEYMEIGPGADLIPGQQGYDERTAAPLAGDDNTVRDDVNQWSVHVPDQDTPEICNEDFHSYWDWMMGGSKTFLPTFNKNNNPDSLESKIADLTGIAIDGLGNSNTAEGDGTHDYFDLHPDSVTDDASFWNYEDDILDTREEIHDPKDTLGGSVISMAQWKAAGSVPGKYWVYDTDGWAYWAEALLPEDATALLLNKITLNVEPDDAWYYGIYVKAQMATSGDWDSFYDDGVSNDGLFLLNQAAGRLPEVTSVIFAADRAFVKAGSSLTLEPIVKVKNGTGEANEKSVTWDIDPMVSTFNGGTISPLPTDEGKVYNVTATSKLDPDFSASISVTVIPANALDVVKGADNQYYYLEYADNCFQKVNEDGTLGPIFCGGADGIPGNDDDRADVVYGSTGYPRYLPTNQGDNSFWAYGPDGKLGTSDDVKIWQVSPPSFDDMTATNPNPMWNADNITITQVSGTGDGANIVKAGKAIQYLAEVLLSGSPIENQEVVWSIITGGKAAGTTIDPVTATEGNVTLAIDENETLTAITLRAISQENNLVYKDVIVTVRPKLSLPAPGTRTFTDTDPDAGTSVLWRILKDNRPIAGTNTVGGLSDGTGTVLIMTDIAYSTGASLLTSANAYYATFNSNNVWQKYENSATGGNTLRAHMDTWYTNFASYNLKAAALNPILRYESETAVVLKPAWNEDNAISEGGTPATGNTGIVFPLSVSEVNRFVGTTDAARLARGTDGVTGWYYLRSPVNTAGSSRVRNSGAIAENSAATNTNGFRPAMWIKP